MYRHSRPEEMDLVPTAQGRSHSVQSDRPSFASSTSLVSPPLAISPEPAYIAATVASQLVNDSCEGQLLQDLEESGIEPCGESAIVATGALKLVNAFLDQLLYNFLSVARSTSLSPLRLAVSDVLKPKLAREAVAGADQELSEYLGDEGLSAFEDAHDLGEDWDLEHAFKRSRLRCMVFCRLGEMEEDEGTEYTKEQQLDGKSTMHPCATEVSPAVAIFLASVLEFIGEQSLLTGGQAAYKRLHISKPLAGSHSHTSSLNAIMGRVVVEEIDMEKVAFNSVLGRLWRTWRARVRSPQQCRSRPLSPGAYQQTSRSTSATPSRDHSSGMRANNQRQDRDDPHPPSVAEILNDGSAASVSLPMNENDVEEIEVPGLALLHDSERETLSAGKVEDTRPKSMFLLPPRLAATSIQSASMEHTSRNAGQSEVEPSAPRSRKRSRSLPTAHATPLVTPATPGSRDPDSSNASLDDKIGSSGTPTLSKQVGEQVEEHKGLVASVLAGATAIGLYGKAAIGSAAIAGVAAAASGQAPDTNTQTSPPSSQAVTEGRHEFEEPQIVESTRLSIEEVRGPTPVELGRTRSRTTSSSKSSALADQSHAKSTDKGSPSSVPEESTREDDPTAIGVARTSNIPVAAMAVPPSREFFNDDGPNADESAWKEKRSSRFVLAAPPSSRSQRSSATSTPPAEGIASNPSNIAPTSEYRPSTLENGALPLAPLREMRENGADADRGILLSESPSLPLSSYRSESPATGHPPRTDSTSFSPSSHTPVSNYHSNRRQQTPTTQAASSAEKASVHGVSSSSVGSYSPTTPKHGRSLSLKRDKDDKDSLRTRSSNDGNGSVVTQRDQTQQSFERLIQGDRTIQYTLTPQNMLNIEAPRTHTAELADFLKNPASPSEGKSRPSTSRSTKERNRNNGVQSSSPREQSQTPTSPRSPSRPLMIPDRHKSAGATPRLPTYEPKESTKDFADFIRSTGPDNGGATINASQQITVRSPNAIRYQQRPISTPRSVSSPSNMEGISMEGRSRASSKSVRRLQPREPQVSASTKESSELAAFIRQGPPPGSDVTPKKLNMSSMSPLADHSRTGTNNRLMISPSSYHTQGSSVQTKSERSSSNSRTGLLENKEKENPNMYMERCQASVDDKAQKQLGVTDPPQSQRKQRRVKDPYAIPTDSDEEYAPEPQSKSKRNEESLMDFLNSVPPPAQSALNTPTPTDSPAPEVAASSKPWKEAQKAQGTPKVGPRTLQKKQSGQGLVSRFGRSSASPKVAVEPKSSNNAKSTTNGVNHRESTGPPQLSLNRAGSSTLFSGPNSFVSVNGANIPSTINPTPPITSSSPDQDWKENKARGLAPPVAAGPQIGSMRGKAGRSNDLIEFLNAGPPPGVTSPISSPAMIKEETGFRQMFGRMKKNKKAVT